MDANSNTNQTPASEAPVETVTPPQPQQQPTPVLPPQTPPPSKKRFSRPVIGGIIAGALVLLGGGSALAYTSWYQHPDKVVHDAIINTLHAKTFTATGTMSYTSDDVTVDITLDTKSDQTNGEFNLNAKIAVDTPEMKQDFAVGGSGRMIDDTLYFKVTGVKETAEDVIAQSGEEFPPYATSIIEKIDNKWISVKPSDYEDAYEDISEQQACLTDLSKKIQSDKAMLREVTDLYREHTIVTVKEELGSKSIQNVGSLGYKVGFDQAAAASFVRGLDGTQLGNELKACNDEVNFAEIADELAEDTASESEKEPTVELWVSRFGHKVTEVSIYGDSENGDRLSMMLQPVFDTNITVEAPQDATSFKTVMEEIQAIIMEQYSEAYNDSGLLLPEGEEFTLPEGISESDLDFYLESEI